MVDPGLSNSQQHIKAGSESYSTHPHSSLGSKSHVSKKKDLQARRCSLDCYQPRSFYLKLYTIYTSNFLTRLPTSTIPPPSLNHLTPRSHDWRLAMTARGSLPAYMSVRQTPSPADAIWAYHIFWFYHARSYRRRKLLEERRIQITFEGRWRRK